MQKYRAFIDTAEEIQIGAITLNELRHVHTACSHSVHGPDGFEPAGMALLGDLAYANIADLLNNIADGAEWPQGSVSQ